jgi:glycosyltransferase involved in cell wall biosynthesis
MVSVIIASYNHEEFVERAVTSVLDQSVKSLEVIVVDDGSTDGTADVVESIFDKRVKLIRGRTNRLLHPRNTALAQAKGRYIAFQNSDDVWMPTKLENQLECIESNLNLTACFTGVELIDGHGRIAEGTWADNLFATQNQSSHSWLNHFFLKGNCLPIPSAITRRKDLLGIGGFRQSLVQLSDFDLWVRLAARGDFYIVPDRLTGIRIVGNQNYSAPSQPASFRSGWEYATVLERFTENELLQQYSGIFPELLPYSTNGAKKIALAVFALELAAKKHCFYWLFADRTIASVLDNPIELAEATEVHGADFIHRFLEERGSWTSNYVSVDQGE